MATPKPSTRQGTLPRLPALAGAFSLAVGLTALCGWTLHVAVLTEAVPGDPSVKPNGAIAFVLCGAAVLLLRDPGAPRARLIAGRLVGLGAATIGALTIGEYLFGGLGIDTLLFADPGSPASSYPGRPSPHAAIAFLSVGLALASLDLDRARGRRPLSLLLVVCGTVILTGAIGWAYGIEYLRGLSTVSGLPVHAAATFVLLWLGLAALRPDCAITSGLFRQTHGAALLRRLAAAGVAIPFGLGFLQVLGQQGGVLDTQTGTALFTILVITIFLVVVAASAGWLERIDDERRAHLGRLRASEEAFRALAEAAVDTIVSADANGTISYFNPGAETLFGHEAADIVGEPLTTLMPARLRKAHRQGFARVLATGQRRVIGRPVELPALTKDGREIPVELSIADWEAGGDRFFTAIMRDISDRKRVERELEDRERRFRTLLEAAPDAMVVVDIAGEVVLSNTQVERMLGHSHDQLVGEKIETLVPGPFPQSDNVLDRVALHRDGSEIPVEIRLSPLQTDEGLLITAAIRDVTERQRHEARLAEAARFFEISRDVLATMDFGGRFVTVNGAWEKTLGWTSEELRGRPFLDYVHPEDSERTAAEAARLADGGENSAFQNRWRTKDGGWRWLEWSVVGVPQEGLLFGAARDVTERLDLERALRDTEELFRTAFDETPIGVALVHPEDGRFLRVNRALCEITGYSSDQLEATTSRAITHPDDHAAGRDAVQRMLAGETASYSTETRFLHPKGHPVPVQLGVSLMRDVDGEPRHFLLQVQDITERKRYEGQLQHLADHDPLTGLYNRRRFEEELTRELAATARYGRSGAVLALDLDNFKYINDSLGHAVGDELISKVGTALNKRLRQTDVLARLGGDEFAVILPEVGESEARLVTDGLLEAVRREGIVDAGDRSSRVSASIGIAPFGHRAGLTGEELMVEADIAMYDAKEAGRDRAGVYDAAGDRQERMQARLTWADRIRAALDDDRFVLHAQPILALAEDHCPRHELLLRLVADDGDLIPPATFLNVAERFDLVQEIDRWVLREAIRLLAEQRRAGREIALEVNVSAKSITEPELPDLIAAELECHGIDGNGLCIEVTETAAIVNVDRAREFASRLRELGCEFALDDFGAGFASFYYLKHLRFDYVKIDGEFIKDLGSNRTNQMVVQAVVQIARGLGKRTVAEFVEDHHTLELLRGYGIDYAQGFHIAPPAPLSEVELSTRAVSGVA